MRHSTFLAKLLLMCTSFTLILISEQKSVIITNGLAKLLCKYNNDYATKALNKVHVIGKSRSSPCGWFEAKGEKGKIKFLNCQSFKEKMGQKISTAVKYLLMDVTEMHDVGSGQTVAISVFNSQAFPVFAAKYANCDYDVPFIVGRFYGKGKLIGAGNKMLFVNGTIPFLRNCLNWLSRKFPPKIVALIMNPDGNDSERFRQEIFEILTDLQIEVKTYTWGEVDSSESFVEPFDVILTVGTFSHEIALMFHQYVFNGGGLLAMFSDGDRKDWLQSYINYNYREDLFLNQLTGLAGFVFLPNKVVLPNNGSYVINEDAWKTPNALDALESLKSSSNLNESFKTFCYETLENCLMSAYQITELATELKSFLQPQPSFDRVQPLIDKYEQYRLRMFTANAKYHLHENEITEHPAAKYFPGQVGKSTNESSQNAEIRYFVIPPSNQHAGYFQTLGLYAPPTAIIEATLLTQGNFENLTVQIGSHVFDQAGYKNCKYVRPLDVVTPRQFRNKTVRLASPYGGLVYIRIPPPEKVQSDVFVEVSIKGAIKAPTFQYGENTNADWLIRRDYPAPWTDFQISTMTITIQSDAVRFLQDAEKVVNMWAQIKTAIHNLIQLTDQTRLERCSILYHDIVSDVILPGLEGVVNMQYHRSFIPPRIYIQTEKAGILLEKEQLKMRGWKVLSQLTNCYVPANSLWWHYWEVSSSNPCKVVSALHAIHIHNTVLGAKTDDIHPDFQPSSYKGKIQAFINNSTSEAKDLENNLKVLFHIQLQKKYGWQSLKQTFKYYTDYPFDSNDVVSIVSQYLKVFSRVVGHNLGPFFQSWRLQVTQEALNEAALFPEANLSINDLLSDH